MRAKSFLRQLYLPAFPLSPVLVFKLWFRPLLSPAVRLSSPHLIFPLLNSSCTPVPFLKRTSDPDICLTPKPPVISYCLQKKKNQASPAGLSRPSQVAGMTDQPPFDSSGSLDARRVAPLPCSKHSFITLSGVLSSVWIVLPLPFSRLSILPHHLECGVSQMGTRILCFQAKMSEANCFTSHKPQHLLVFSEVKGGGGS